MKKDFKDRLPEFNKELVALCKKYRIEIVAVLTPTVSAVISQIHMVDLDNPEMMTKYGLVEKKEAAPSLLVN